MATLYEIIVSALPDIEPELDIVVQAGLPTCVLGVDEEEILGAGMSAEDCLMGAFPWSETPQGAGFWVEAFERLHNAPKAAPEK